MDWQLIPDLPLQKIFLYLNKRERLYAALTCRRWLAALFNPQLWRTFTFRWHEYPAEQHKRRYDMEMYRLYREFCVVARHFRFVIVPATNDFYALHGFLQQWRICLDSHAAVDEPLCLRAFHLTFASEVIGAQSFGTGGRLLDTLKAVLARMEGLQSLALDDLLLDVTDALTLLEEVVFLCGLSLRRLSVVSVCKLPAGFYAAALFPNLELLRLSPLHLNSEVLEAVIAETRLLRLVLRQDAFSMWPREDAHLPFRPPSDEDWRAARRRSPWLRLRLEVTGLQRCGDRQGLDGVMWPSRDAPVDEVLFTTDEEDLALSLAMTGFLADYSKTLTTFGHGRLPTSDRQEDAMAWAELAASCRGLQALHVAGRVPTWVLLLLAASLPGLHSLVVRREAVFPQRPPDAKLWREVDQATFEAAADAAASLSRAEREIAFLMQSPRWRFLEEEEFVCADPVNEEEMIRG